MTPALPLAAVTRLPEKIVPNAMLSSSTRITLYSRRSTVLARSHLALLVAFSSAGLSAAADVCATVAA